MPEPLGALISLISVIFAGATFMFTLFLSLIAMFAFWGKGSIEKKMLIEAKESVSEGIIAEVKGQLTDADSEINKANRDRIKTEVDDVFREYIGYLYSGLEKPPEDDEDGTE